MIKPVQRFGSAAFILALLLAVSLSACDSGGFKVNVTFAGPQDIREGTPVLFNNAVVGTVSDVQQRDNSVRAELSLEQEAVSSIDGSAAVVLNRFKQGAPLEIYNRSIRDNVALQEGQSLTGLDSMVQLGAWMVGDAILAGSVAMSQYAESFRKYLLSDEFQQEKEQIRGQLKDAARAAQEAINEIEVEIAESTTELVASQNAAAKAVEELGEELAPIVEELAINGANLMARLEEFGERLATAEPEQQKAGQEFLASLLATLEKLNQSIERGLAEKKPSDPQKD